MEPSPIRVLLNISCKSCHWQTACESPEEIVKIAIDAIQKNNWLSPNASASLKHTLLVTEKWTPQVFIVFDLFNDSYDPDTAHLPDRNDLPVFPIYISRKGEKETIDLGARSQEIDNLVNADVRAVLMGRDRQAGLKLVKLSLVFGLD
jgi:hypothetical protein